MCVLSPQVSLRSKSKKSLKDFIHLESIHWGPSVCKEKKMIQELIPTVLILNDPNDYSEIIGIAGQHYTFKLFNQSGHMVTQYIKKKNPKSAMTQHYKFSQKHQLQESHPEIQWTRSL